MISIIRSNPFFYEKPVDPYPQDLQNAIEENDLTTIEILVFCANGRVHVNEPLPNGLLPLHFAIQKQHTDSIVCLIQNGADVNSKNKCGVSPLHAAVLQNNLSFARLLLENGAQQDIMDDQGSTPWAMAMKTRQYELIDLFLKNGGENLLMRSLDGILVFDWLIINGKKDLNLSNLLHKQISTISSNPQRITQFYRVFFIRAICECYSYRHLKTLLSKTPKGVVYEGLINHAILSGLDNHHELFGKPIFAPYDTKSTDSFYEVFLKNCASGTPVTQEMLILAIKKRLSEASLLVLLDFSDKDKVITFELIQAAMTAHCGTTFIQKLFILSNYQK